MRYRNQNVFINTKEAYKKYLEKTRGIKQIKQFGTPKFKHPVASETKNFNVINHIWGVGDRFYKLAAEYYDDPTMWWVIALYNHKPTEFHANLGDTIFIPVPLESVLFHIGY